jgi:predicted HTH domain antitoxin
MRMQKENLTIELPKGLLALLSKRFTNPSDKVKELTVLELYREGEISSGKAAELLNMERFEFIRYASRLGIPFLDLPKGELEKDIVRSRTVSGDNIPKKPK